MKRRVSLKVLYQSILRRLIMKNDTAPVMTAGQLGELVEAFPKDIPSQLIQAWVGQKGVFGRSMKDMLFDLSMDPEQLIKSWEKFYKDVCKKVCGIEFDFSKTKVPNEQFGFGWIVPSAKGITPSIGYEICQHLFPCLKLITGELDQVVINNDRNPDKNYIIRVRNRREADEELKDFSADYLKENKIKAITLHERELLEAWYYCLTKEHLDAESDTLCSGSRDSIGRVVRASWYDGSFGVDSCNSYETISLLRARAVVSS